MDELTEIERGLILTAHAHGPFEAALIQADSRVPLDAALQSLTPEALEVWNEATHTRSWSPSPGKLPVWVAELFESQKRLVELGGWASFCTHHHDTRGLAKIAHGVGKHALAGFQRVEMAPESKSACKSVRAKLGSNSGDYGTLGATVVLLACGVRWRDAVIGLHNSRVSPLVQIACRHRYSDAAPQLRLAIAELSEVLEWQ